MHTSRDRLLDQLVIDLIGPHGGPREEIRARPSDQYVSGILYPPTDKANPEDDDVSGAGEDDDGTHDQGAPPSMMPRPSVMGISFAMEGAAPTIAVRASAARYTPRLDSRSERLDAWMREALSLSPPEPVVVREGIHVVEVPNIARWWFRGVRRDGRWQVTVSLENTQVAPPESAAFEAAHLFQVRFEVEALGDATIVPRRVRPLVAQDPLDEDTRIDDLIYRDAEEFAVGHTCGATWTIRDGRVVIASEWIPRQLVKPMSADGHAVFAEEAAKRTHAGRDCFDAEALAGADSPVILRDLLEAVPDAYERWLRDTAARVDHTEATGSLSPSRAAQARANLDHAAAVSARIRDGIAFLTKPANDDVHRAFVLAQRAMIVQRRWAERRSDAKLTWRPLQLAFQLINLRGIACHRRAGDANARDRAVMDLLWSPAGGGKREALHALAAFTLFWRRLRDTRPDHDGAGVAVVVRYPRRFLLKRAFERIARVVLACEYLRRDAATRGDHRLGAVPFSIGHWADDEATPRNVSETRRSFEARERAKPFNRCLACSQGSLTWDTDRKSPSFLVACGNAACPLHGAPLPVWTIDEDVFREQPGLVIGTLDKFAQIVRKADTHRLFDGAGGPPELIIQDELHLISGPLGTVAGVYETAIDLICRRGGVRPKIIGSTATIRRARDQVRQLFDRDVLQFPPPVLDASDSCFAVTDEEAPGRLYAGVTTAGRSPKFMLQAMCASLLQGAAEDAVVAPVERDHYWTLVTYFNSLRELGGALVMMQDDVHDSMANFAALHGTARRHIDEPLELTSRVEQADIPTRLVTLEQRYDPTKPATAQEQDTSIVLATNMISVGVDIARLGLMAVNGQPKTMSEYIQATSRVGRNRVPGLVVTLYNVGRPRDRSHYEAFRTWHQTLYRDVEATSVTPFAPRARDRALHAAMVALARHLVDGMLDDTTITPARREALEALVDEVVARAASVDPTERDAVGAELRAYLDNWEGRGSIGSYWDDFHPNDSLLVSAEVVAEAQAVEGGRWARPAKPTPNSMRDVEAQVQFRLAPSLTDRTGGN